MGRGEESGNLGEQEVTGDKRRKNERKEFYKGGNRGIYVETTQQCIIFCSLGGFKGESQEKRGRIWKCKIWEVGGLPPTPLATPLQELRTCCMLRIYLPIVCSVN